MMWQSSRMYSNVDIVFISSYRIIEIKFICIHTAMIPSNKLHDILSTLLSSETVWQRSIAVHDPMFKRLIFFLNPLYFSHCQMAEKKTCFAFYILGIGARVRMWWDLNVFVVFHTILSLYSFLFIHLFIYLMC